MCGTSLHWDGASFSRSNSGTKEDLASIWGSRADDVWAGGANGTLLHWNGTAWSPMPGVVSAQTLNGIWGSSDKDVWILNGADEVLHWTGSFAAQKTGAGGAEFGIWGSSEKDVWVTAVGGKII